MQLFCASKASFRIRTQGSGNEFIAIIKPRGDTMHSPYESSRPASHHAKAQATILFLRGALDRHLAFLSIDEAEHSAVGFNISARFREIIKCAFCSLNNVTSDEGRAFFRALLAILYAALPFKNGPSGKIVLRELGKNTCKVNLTIT